jgi:3-phosphoshikimate 1-carboxyvinyltransferase
VEIHNSQFTISNSQFSTTLTPPTVPLTPLRLTIPGDISSAAFLIVAALITPGSEITIQNVGLNPTRTGLLDALKSMGANIQISNLQSPHNEAVGDLTISSSPLHGTDISGPLVVRMIDEFPAFAVAAAYADSPTIVREAVELRHKESDRITKLCEQLRAVGAEITEAEDGFTLPGNTIPRGGIVNPHGDHRLAMSLAVAGLGAQGPIAVQNPNIIHESYPEFQSTLESLGAQID